jgi:hypothetical protein
MAVAMGLAVASFAGTGLAIFLIRYRGRGHKRPAFRLLPWVIW